MFLYLTWHYFSSLQKVQLPKTVTLATVELHFMFHEVDIQASTCSAVFVTFGYTDSPEYNLM